MNIVTKFRVDHKAYTEDRASSIWSCALIFSVHSKWQLTSGHKANLCLLVSRHFNHSGPPNFSPLHWKLSVKAVNIHWCISPMIWSLSTWRRISLVCLMVIYSCSLLRPLRLHQCILPDLPYDIIRKSAAAAGASRTGAHDRLVW